MEENNRRRGIIVYPLIDDSIYETEHVSFDRYVVGINENTEETYLIQVPEGVGYPVSHNKPWRFNDYNLESHWFTVAEVRSWADTSRPLELADQIRSFGARLESNFAQMAHRLTCEEPQQDDYNSQVAEMFRAERAEQVKS